MNGSWIKQNKHIIGLILCLIAMVGITTLSFMGNGLFALFVFPAIIGVILLID